QSPTGPRRGGRLRPPEIAPRLAAVRRTAVPHHRISCMADARRILLYHFCRLQLPAVALPDAAVERHLERTFDLYRGKVGDAAKWDAYLENLYAVDWFLCCACLEREPRAWELLFAARANRADCLLVDALRSRAVRLYPRDEEK